MVLRPLNPVYLYIPLYATYAYIYIYIYVPTKPTLDLGSYRSPYHTSPSRPIRCSISQCIGCYMSLHQELSLNPTPSGPDTYNCIGKKLKEESLTTFAQHLLKTKDLNPIQLASYTNNRGLGRKYYNLTGFGYLKPQYVGYLDPQSMNPKPYNLCSRAGVSQHRGSIMGALVSTLEWRIKWTT